MVWEIVRETFELDGRLFKSLRLLLTRPGVLASEFSENRRAQYMSPIRMYLFVSIVFFFILSLDTEIPADVSIEVSQAQAEMEAELELDDDNISLFKSLLSDAHRNAVDRIVGRTNSLSRCLLYTSDAADDKQ